MVSRILLLASALSTALLCSAQTGSPRQAFLPKPVQSPLGSSPLTFELNRGQLNKQVKFLSRGSGYNAFLTTDGMTVALRPSNVELSSGAKQSTRRLVQFRLTGAAKNPAVVGEDQQPGVVNYFIGNQRTKWKTNIPTYGKVRYKNIYRGIDLVYYGNHRQLEYDFQISPGANPDNIEFEIQGANRIELDSESNLVLYAGAARLAFQTPSIYEVAGTSRTNLQGRYVIRDANHVAFQVAQHDASKALVIDPVLVYSTYLGGSGDDEARAVGVDASGSVYLAGYTDSVDFPLTTAGSLPAGAPHVYVAKLDPSGSHLIYVDYLGGNGQDYGYALAMNASNEVFVTGSTNSSNFPVVNGYQSTYPGSFNSFVTHISADGSTVLYSTYLGGNGSDIPAGIALDGNNDLIVAGYTSSTNFPVSNAYQSTVSPNAGGFYGNYGFLTKFSPDGSSLVYSTYLGGSSNVPYNCGGTPCWGEPTSTVTGLSVDSSGNAYVAGLTNTYDFPTSSTAYSTSNTTQQNALVSFVTKFGQSGNLLYSTYFYESSGLMTDIAAIAVDNSGSVYATGQAISDGTFPVTSSTICDPGSFGIACSYGFVTKFDATGSHLLYSTFLGPNNLESPTSILLDTNNDAYVAGITASNSFSTVNAIDSYAGGNDLLLVELDPTGTSQLWATYMGGSGDENAATLAIDSSDNLYVAGTTTSTDLPVTAAAFQSSYAGNTDSVAMKISPASAASVLLNPTSLQYTAQALGSTSPAQSVLLRNMGSGPLALSISSTGDFSETDTCGATVSGGTNCSISIQFTPTQAGLRTGTIVLTDDAAGSPQIVSLSGVGTGPNVSVSPSVLSFPTTPVGRSAVPQSVTVTNSGNVTLHISSVQATGDFSQNSTCGTVMAGSSCTINVNFTPSTAGNRTGTLSITDDAFSSPQTMSLAGAGTDFSVTSAPTSVTVSSGSPATYKLTVASLGAAFSSAVTLTCPTLPTGAHCSFSPSAVTPGSGQGASTLTVSTGSTTSAEVNPQTTSPFALSIWLQVTAMGMVIGFFATPRSSRRKLRNGIFAASLLCLLFLGGCAGGTGIAPQGGGSGMSSGTYTVTVAGTSGSLQHSVTLTLVVK